MGSKKGPFEAFGASVSGQKGLFGVNLGSQSLKMVHLGTVGAVGTDYFSPFRASVSGQKGLFGGKSGLSKSKNGPFWFGGTVGAVGIVI